MFLTSSAARSEKGWDTSCDQRDSCAQARISDSPDRMTPTCPHIVRRSELRNFSASSNEPYCSCFKAAS
jgi:hypothetical protein